MKQPFRIMVLLVAICVQFGAGCRSNHQSIPTVNVLIAPYQDLAMMVNAKPLGLEKKYGVNINVETLAWENIVPTIASASTFPSIGFASYTQFLTEESRLNPPGSDPVVFVYPAYVFNGGGFVSFNPSVPQLTASSMSDRQLLRRFLGYRIGAQKGSIYEMMIFSLANQAGLDPKSLHLVDLPLNTALLAAERKSIDIGEAGLTQETEAIKQGGRVVVTMEATGFADLTGFICKQSFLSTHPEQVRAVMNMWFDSVRFVMSNVDANSQNSLAYLRANAATQYTLAQYRDALSQEYFPLTPKDAAEETVAAGGRYSAVRIGAQVSNYLMATGQVRTPPVIPSFSISP